MTPWQQHCHSAHSNKDDVSQEVQTYRHLDETDSPLEATSLTPSVIKATEQARNFWFILSPFSPYLHIPHRCVASPVTGTYHLVLGCNQ